MVGVEATYRSEARSSVRARRGVLIAAGGFEGSDDDARRARRARRRGLDDGAARHQRRRADPGRELLGAATDYSALGWFCPGLEHPDGSGSFTLGFRGGLMVDATGQRYANECLPYDRFGREMAKAPDRIPSWFVFDDREGGRLPAIAMPEGDPADHLAAGTWVRADTLEELAAAIGVPAGRAGRDRRAVQRLRRHRRRRGLRPRRATSTTPSSPAARAPTRRSPRSTRPPYYAARFVLSDLGTKGGLVTDAAGRVLREDGSAIAGPLRLEQLRRLGLRLGLPRPRRPARLGDGVRLAGRARPARLTPEIEGGGGPGLRAALGRMKPQLGRGSISSPRVVNRAKCSMQA